MGTGSLQEKERFCRHPLAHCKVQRIGSIFSTLFGRWQQRWRLSLQQFVIVSSSSCCKTPFSAAVCRDRITLAVLELRENEDLAKLERTWWIDKGQCGSGSTFMKVSD